jgi:hypothetical protein
MHIHGLLDRLRNNKCNYLRPRPKTSEQCTECNLI